MAGGRGDDDVSRAPAILDTASQLGGVPDRTATEPPTPPIDRAARSPAPDHLWRRALANGRVLAGGGALLLVLLACVATLPWTLSPSSAIYYNAQDLPTNAAPAGGLAAFGTDFAGRSLLARCLMGGAISLAVGAAAAAISVVLGLTVGLFAGYAGGWLDAALMRTVDVMYGLPYILLVILFKIALERPLESLAGWLNLGQPRMAANLVVLFLAIGLVSWLTMARVVRGQVLSLRGQPFIEAARAAGLPRSRIFLRHLLPNLVGPVIVYATLTVPQAILQESFLSFLGLGIQEPLPSWGLLAAQGSETAFKPFDPYWWQVLFPCLLLAVTLLALNFLGDGLRDLFDPKREAAKL